MARPKGSAEVLEARRHQALRLLDEGYSLHEVGALVGCAASSVMRWRDTRDAGGKAALEVRSSPGRPPKLTPARKQKLVKLLLKGAMAHGHATELWTAQRVADLIEKNFRVRYHRSHVARLLHDLGWSCQKPERRALERDEEAIRRWKKRGWARVKKTQHA